MMDLLKDHITIRKIRNHTSEKNFVLDSWIRSYEHSPNNYLRGPDYRESKDLEIKLLLENSTVLICTPKNHQDVYLGFIVFSYDIIEYCYVKHKYRKQGIAKYLWEAAKEPRSATHWDERIDHIEEKYGIKKQDYQKEDN